MRRLTSAIARDASRDRAERVRAEEAARVPARGRYDEGARQTRLAWITERTGGDLSALAETRLVSERLTRNVENMIGAVEVPVGLAGPLLIEGERVRETIHAPLATTEGALVASASRGASAVTRAGGVRTRVLSQRMTRAPVFQFATVADACRFVAWLEEQGAEIRARVGEVSAHAVLCEVSPVLVDRAVHAIFRYETGDAAGQNMTTATTWHACQWILETIGARGIVPVRFIIEGNASGDKKVNRAALGGARGWNVVAECDLDEATLRETLKVSAADLLASYALVRDGAEHAGMLACNVNVANAVAALFVATGQDIACVHESSLGELELRAHRGGVRARMHLPGLVLGTVGGGTHLPAQRAALEILGCTGTGSAHRLAEIVAGVALALDLSTLAAIASGAFASAHERLGRNRPSEPILESHLTAAFFASGLRRAYHDESLVVHEVTSIDSDAGASILGELTSRRMGLGKGIGLHHRRLVHSRGTTDVVVKVKAVDAEVMLMMQEIAAMCGPAVARAHAHYRGELGFAGCHLRELAVYGQTDRRFTAHAPAVYDTIRDDGRERFALVLERLGDVRLLDSADDPRGWGSAEIEAAIRGIGAVHAIWMGRERALAAAPWLGVAPSAERMAAMRPLWSALAEHAAVELPSLMDDAELARHRALIATIPEWWSDLESMPRTLAHNDFNPRNIALRAGAGPLTLCAYDWELATLHLPQHDVAELLAFVLDDEATAREVEHYVELHRRAVADAGGVVPPPGLWRRGFTLALRDLLVNRFALYLMAHSFRQYGFLERSLRTLRHLLDLDLEAR